MPASIPVPVVSSRQPVSVLVWKALLLCFVVYALALDIWALTYWQRALVPEKAGRVGITRIEQVDERWRIGAMTAESPFAAAGVKPGDEITFDHKIDRRRFLGTDETIGVTIHSDGATRHAEIRPIPAKAISPAFRAYTIIAWVTSALMLAVGFVIGWRRADSNALRALSASLLSQVMNFFYNLPPGGLAQEFAVYVFGPISPTLAYGGLLYFSLAYPGHMSLLRIRWIALAFACVGGLLIAMSMVGLARSLFVVPVANFDSVSYFIDLFVSVAALAALLAGWWRSTGITKQRFAWLALSTGSISLMYLIGIVNAMAGLYSAEVVTIVQGCVIFAANAGLGYAVLRHRVLDFGFAVNRAVVYATTSLLLAAAFILSGQLINGLIHFQGREQSRFVDIAIGVGIALIARQAVRWVDPRVQRIFFRRWHEATAKLARFRHDSIHGVDAGALQSGLIEAIQDFSGAKEVAIYVAGPDGIFHRGHSTMESAPPMLGADHPVVIALAHLKPILELPASSREISAALALPMAVRGRLTGAVLLGEKPDNDIYRTDEIKLLAGSVQDAGLELEVRRLEALDQAVVRKAAPESALLAVTGAPDRTPLPDDPR